MDAILREELTPFVTRNEVILILFSMSLLVGFLNTAAAGCIVSSNRQANHTTVTELHWLLNKALAKGATPYDCASVVVLDGSCKYLGGAGTNLIYQNNDRQPLECASTIATELLARAFASLCINNQFTGRQELVDHLYGDVHVSALIAAKVDDEPVHAFHVEVGKGDKHLGICLFTKVLDAYIASLGFTFGW